VEHIVPESLGNDLLVLGRGWVCDKCNNMHSAFETRAVAQSILGVERCILKVVTKKGKPSRSRVHGITWFAEPDAVPGVVVAEADWSKVLVLTDEAGQCGMAVFPVHDRSCDDIARLLLKMGIELLAVVMSAESQETRWNLSEAKDCVLGRSSAPWPYFLLRSPEVVCHFTSILAGCPDEHEYIRSCGFD
jgi:hypothetical protein